jgi:hypothetical protein
MATPIEGGEVQGAEPTGESSPGLNPAWGEALSAVPEQFHPTLTQHFQQWDQSAQQRIESVNEKLKPFEGYQPFVENGITPQEVEQALQVMYHLNADPQSFYNALVETYKFGAQPEIESQEIEGEEEEPANFQDPRFDQLQQGLDLVAQTLLQQEQQKLERQAEAEIDAEVAALKESHPGISDDFIYSLMTNGYTSEQVGEKWASVAQSILQSNPRPFAPNVMGTSSGGTGLPSQAIDPKKLDDRGTRDLVAQMVRLAHGQNG